MHQKNFNQLNFGSCSKTFLTLYLEAMLLSVCLSLHPSSIQLRFSVKRFFLLILPVFREAVFKLISKLLTVMI